MKALGDNSLCNQLRISAGHFNISDLLRQTDIMNLCRQTPVFLTVFIAGPNNQPSSLPSGQPTSSPSKPPTIPKRKIFSMSVVGILTIVTFIGLLRFLPSMMDVFMAKKAYVRGHLYNILVVLNDEEMAVLENIRHEDIAFFRRITETEKDSHMNDWTMNTSSEPMQKRQEVLFYDVYDLLGESGMGEEAEFSADHSLEGDKVVTKENYVHNAHLQTGMIIRVRPAKGWVPKETFNDMNSFSSASSEPHNIDSYPTVLVKIKGGRRGALTLDQLPAEYVTETYGSSRIAIDTYLDSNTVLPYRPFSPGNHSSYRGMGHEEESPQGVPDFIPPISAFNTNIRPRNPSITGAMGRDDVLLSRPKSVGASNRESNHNTSTNMLRLQTQMLDARLRDSNAPPDSPYSDTTDVAQHDMTISTLNAAQSGNEITTGNPHLSDSFDDLDSSQLSGQRVITGRPQDSTDWFHRMDGDEEKECRNDFYHDSDSMEEEKDSDSDDDSDSDEEEEEEKET